MKYNVVGAYFSPTGGTERAIRRLCACWGEDIELVDLGDPKHPDVKLGSRDLLVLALPVYANTIPNVPGLLDRISGENTPCVVAATYGNCKYGHALAQMQKLMGDRGFRCVAGTTIITPHVFAPTLGADRPDEQDMADLQAFAAKVEEKLELPQWEEAELPGEPEPAFRHIPPIPKLRDWDICMGCAFCAYVCPTGAMDPKTLLWNDDKCISCMTCVSKCPNGALGYNSSVMASKLTAAYTQRLPIETFF